MKATEITNIIERLNQSFIKNGLIIEYHHNDPKDTTAWGEHVWLLKYISLVDTIKYLSRVCWLNNSQSFEMRHGGGGLFAWWIDHMICNEVGFIFNGFIIDDGDGKKTVAQKSKYDNLSLYLKRQIDFLPNELKKSIIDMYLEEIPPEFRQEVTRSNDVSFNG